MFLLAMGDWPFKARGGKFRHPMCPEKQVKVSLGEKKMVLGSRMGEGRFRATSDHLFL